MTQRYRSDSEQETAAIASGLARRLPPGSVVLLRGELGAGKTAFVRGFVEGVGIDPYEVSSPTFTVIQEYGGGRVYHVDLYRLGSNEVRDLGLEELPESGALVCIEWAERMPYTLSGAVTVEITYLSDTARQVIVKGYPER